MKPIFGIDITSNKNNEDTNCGAFISRSISSVTKESFAAKTDSLNETVKKSQLPGWVQVVKYLLGLYAIIVLVGIIRALPDTGIEQAFKNAPLLIISGIVCGGLWLALHLYSKKKEREVLQDAGVEAQAEAIETSIDGIYNELDVPQNAPTVDIMMFKYVEKNGEAVPKATGMQTCEFFNVEVKIFVRDGYLHLADLENVYSFNYDDLRSIKTVNKRVSLLSWNKEVGYDEERYSRYKITVNNVGNIMVKPYHILTLIQNGEEWGIYFPCYELDIFEVLTKIKAEEAE